jgi:uncharacterized membrane protein YgaE (UPF0421/DUF939 family)
MRFLKSFGQFWYDFLIGDDWKIAVAVVLAVAVLVGAMSAHLFGDSGLAIFGGILVVIAFAISLALDVRVKSK